MSVAYLAEAMAELEEAADWMERERRGWGARFVFAVQETLGRVADHPELGVLVRRSRRHGEIRKLPIQTFPYVIVYGRPPGADAILVIAVAHGRRRSEYWAGR